MNSNLLSAADGKQLIGITGFAGSGKDTVGAWLCSYCSFESYAMALPLKAGLAAMGFAEPVSRDEKEQQVSGFGFSWRDAAQKLGTEWGRNLDPDIWLKLAELKISSTPKLVITDVRFENEAAMIRRHGGTVIHIKGRQADLGNLAAHASEQGLVKLFGDYLLDNSGSKEALLLQLGRIFHE